MRIFGYEVTKAKTEEIYPDSLKRMSNVIISPWERGRELYSPNDFNKLIAAYKSWVYICASKNSNTVAAAPLKLYVGKQSKSTKILVKTAKLDRKVEARIRKQGNLIPYHRKAVELEEVLDHPFLEMIKNVNPMINRFDLWDATQLWMELTGNAYWYVYKNNMGMPVELWPLPPQSMKIVASQDKIIAGYVYHIGSTKIPFASEEIIHFKFHSPAGGLYGTGPLAAVIDTYINDASIRTFESTLMQNMGRPEAVLSSKEPIAESDFKRIKDRWKQQYAGSKKAGQTILLENGLEYTPITLTPREMNYILGRKMNREEIAAAFGVPMSKLTVEAVNLANAYVGEHQYMQDTIEPRLRRIEETINANLMPMYDDNLFVAYDPVVPSDKEFELKERESNLGKYITTINEEREKMGLDDVEWGDIPLAGPGIAPLGENKPVAPAGPAGQIPPEKKPPVSPEGNPPKVEKPPKEEVPEKELETLVEKILARVKQKLENENKI